MTTTDEKKEWVAWMIKEAKNYRETGCETLWYCYIHYYSPFRAGHDEIEFLDFMKKEDPEFTDYVLKTDETHAMIVEIKHCKNGFHHGDKAIRGITLEAFKKAMAQKTYLEREPTEEAPKPDVEEKKELSADELEANFLIELLGGVYDQVTVIRDRIFRLGIRSGDDCLDRLSVKLAEVNKRMVPSEKQKGEMMAMKFESIMKKCGEEIDKRKSIKRALENSLNDAMNKRTIGEDWKEQEKKWKKLEDEAKSKPVVKDSGFSSFTGCDCTVNQFPSSFSFGSQPAVPNSFSFSKPKSCLNWNGPGGNLPLAKPKYFNIKLDESY